MFKEFLKTEFKNMIIFSHRKKDIISYYMPAQKIDLKEIKDRINKREAKIRFWVL